MNKNQKRLTYAAAHAVIWTRLAEHGWTMDLGLRYPRARYGHGRVTVALFFKPQALWQGSTDRGTPQVNQGHSCHVDVRQWAAMGEAEMMREVEKIVAGMLQKETDIAWEAAG